MSIVENIKRLSKEKGTTIPKLGMELGFGNGAIYNWDKSSPSIDKIQKVAEYFKESVDVVLYGFELTRFEELFRIIMNKRTCEQFANDSSIDLDIVENYAFGITTEKPPLDLVKKLASSNPYKLIVDDESLFAAAGYKLEEIGSNPLDDIPLELLHHYQEQGMSESEMAVAYAKFREAELQDVMNEPDTIAAHHDGEIQINTIPDWATSKDKLDFKKFLEQDAELMFDGKPMSEESRQRILGYVEGLFWEAKELNKKARSKKQSDNT
ncbi:helix-turn-helix domain-containing protein [Paenibacillus sp. y28]|uniref:helix-turn-helix domain-containing protein n=1 Tax=Paenibacillus sp. y28 TaxID=3129110 RepID=UPI0030173CBC